MWTPPPAADPSTTAESSPAAAPPAPTPSPVASPPPVASPSPVASPPPAAPLAGEDVEDSEDDDRPPRIHGLLQGILVRDAPRHRGARAHHRSRHCCAPVLLMAFGWSHSAAGPRHSSSWPLFAIPTTSPLWRVVTALPDSAARRVTMAIGGDVHTPSSGWLTAPPLAATAAVEEAVGAAAAGPLEVGSPPSRMRGAATSGGPKVAARASEGGGARAKASPASATGVSAGVSAAAAPSTMRWVQLSAAGPLATIGM